MRRARTDWAVLLSGDRLVGHLLLEELPARLIEGSISPESPEY